LKFSIIIPTFNRANFICLAIDSVLNQDYKSFEIIVVNDGSTDDTKDVLIPYLSSIKYIEIKNSERGAARNVGIANAVGDYITFLDSDDYLLPNYFSNAFKFITEYGFPPFYHQAYIIKRGEKERTMYAKDNDVLQFIKGNPLSCMGVFMRQDIASAFKFNEDRSLSGSEDWELWLRVVSNVGIRTSKMATAVLVDHNFRSVLNFNESDLLLRKELALKYAFQDELVLKRFTPYKKLMESYCDSYIALHLVLSGKKLATIKYILFAIKNNYKVIFSRRFLAIIKRLFL
jgi:glycosyltransferase involved in cell wall biosynthesis